jgi:DNA-binding HxlR family transcriptional regulator
MKQPDTPETLCPIARAAAVICDRWTILILRELRMGNDRFDGLQAQTGMSSNLLTQRLKFMEENGLIERRLYHDRPKRYAYGLTEKARELDGLMLTLRLWGMRHGGLDPQAEGAVAMTHRRTGTVIDANWHLPEADAPFSFSQIETRINPGWAAERAARAAAFETQKRIQVGKRLSRGTSRTPGPASKRKPKRSA